MGRTTLLIGITVGIALLALSSGAAAQTPTATATPDLDFGEEVYREECVGCHAEDGTGIGMPNQPDFTNRSMWRTTSKEQLIDSAMNGKGAMPGFEGDSIDLNGDIVHYGRSEIVDVLAYSANEFGTIDWSQVGTAADGGTPTATMTATATATETETEEPSPTETGMPGPSVPLAVAGALGALYLIRRD